KMREFLLNDIKATGTTVGDVHFSKVTAMFNFDGSDGDTTTSGLDSSNKNLTVSYSSGDQLSNTQKKFGATSLYVADNVTLSSSDGFNMGTGDFTIEAWYYFTSFSNSFGHYDQWAGTTTGSGNVQMWNSTSAQGKIKWYYDGSSNFTSSTTMSTGQWYHVAYVRESGTLKIYFNGTVDSNTQSYSSQFGKTGTVYLGDQHAGGGSAPQYYIDDLRVTKGLARYTSNFTAPTSAHLTAGGDSFKQVIVNEDADGVIVGTGGINPVRIAKAWVHFDGTAVTTLESYNISSVTDRGTGLYKINFSTNMTSTSYTAAGTVSTGSDQTTPFVIRGTTYATDGFSFVTNYSGTSSIGYSDPNDVTVTVFGN
ncbi:MAG: LamG domain-containing protein, partial [Anaerolineales bacterium]|nr:LamG domain-containing protein [Anaerolineales bacterium]